MVYINGEQKDAAGTTVAEYLDALGLRRDRIAVELNEQIVSESAYAQTLLQDEDVMEIVSFVGGG